MFASWAASSRIKAAAASARNPIARRETPRALINFLDGRA